MADPVLIHAFNEEERGIPLSDEDVARGHLEDGWVPVISCRACDYQRGMRAHATATSTLTFFECAWQLICIPDGAWVTEGVWSTMRKTRLVEEDEELVLEPIDDARREHAVIVCKSREDGYVDHIGVCYSTGHALSMRKIGHHPDEHVFAATGPFDCFLVCKRVAEPFVLK